MPTKLRKGLTHRDSTLKIEQRKEEELRSKARVFGNECYDFAEEEEQEGHIRSSYKGRRANALAPGAEEGRDKLRKAAGSCK